MIEGALIPAIISIGNALSVAKKKFTINTIMALFLKDFYYASTEERGTIQKTIEANLETYYSSLFKMIGNYEIGNSKNTRNPAFTSLRAYLENIAHEDNLRIQLLSLRIWF